MEIIDSFEQVKTWLAAPKGIQSLLHVHAGLVLYFVFLALMPRRHVSSFPIVLVPLLLVAAIQLSNELADYLTKPHYRWADGALDSFNTLFWPSLLTLVFWRRARERTVERQRSTAAIRSADAGPTHRRSMAGIAKPSQSGWRNPPSSQLLKRILP